MKSILVLVFALAANLAFAQPAPQQRPTAIQIMAQQLAAAIAQNAELVERVGQLEDRVAAMSRQVQPKPPDPAEPPKPAN